MCRKSSHWRAVKKITLHARVGRRRCGHHTTTVVSNLCVHRFRLHWAISLTNEIYRIHMVYLFVVFGLSARFHAKTINPSILSYILRHHHCRYATLEWRKIPFELCGKAIFPLTMAICIPVGYYCGIQANHGGQDVTSEFTQRLGGLNA